MRWTDGLDVFFLFYNNSELLTQKPTLSAPTREPRPRAPPQSIHSFSTQAEDLLLRFVQCDDLMDSMNQAEVRSCPVGAVEPICRCCPYPPLPPPPPPPPPPRLLVFTVAPTCDPAMKPWWKELLVLGLISFASLVFAALAFTICYKAMKRKPLRKEENGTSRAEYAMSSRCLKTVDSNNTGV
ncbi:proline-rich membrane anchor 1 [Centroberyx affinis]|uniref:proline-rich membrane anchor 1 n=1 Tax=Centroberyx affinis TaxID=166261 RepID=UPI003A5C6FC1